MDRATLNAKIDKWRPTVFFGFVGVFALILGIQGYLQRYPTIDRLLPVSGCVEDFSVSEPKEHIVTMKLSGASPPITSRNVDLFPLLAQNLRNGAQVEFWVEPDDYPKDSEPTIWQLKVDGKILASLAETIDGYKDRSSFVARSGASFTFVGAVLWAMVTSKRPEISGRLYRNVILFIYLAALGISLWLSFHRD